MKGIKAAQKKNEETGKMSAGGSTITQQLAKNLFLTSHRSYTRKAEEAIITVMIETFWDKQRILTAYLNVAEFGNGIYGVEAAAQHYHYCNTATWQAKARQTLQHTGSIPTYVLLERREKGGGRKEEKTSKRKKKKNKKRKNPLRKRLAYRVISLDCRLALNSVHKK